MGRLFEYQDEITNTVLRQKLYDEWGERGSLQTTCRRVTLTLKEFGILDNMSKVRYVLKKHPITKDAITNFILYCAMLIDGQTYYSFSQLREFNILFPFDYNMSKEQILEDTNFMMTNLGDELSVSLMNN